MKKYIKLQKLKIHFGFTQRFSDSYIMSYQNLDFKTTARIIEYNIYFDKIPHTKTIDDATNIFFDYVDRLSELSLFRPTRVIFKGKTVVL